MIRFQRYTHVNDLLEHYAKSLGDELAQKIISSGVGSSKEAEGFSKFIWLVVDAIHEDEENGILVLGSTNNIEMIPDLEYEVSTYMKTTGFHNVWIRVSENA